MKTGQIIDFYDDLTGSVLKEAVAYSDIPEFVKEAEYLDEEARNKLPDDVFALVMLDNGQPIRKYACQDAGNTALSVFYFLENRDKLPTGAQKVAAANLIKACGWYGLPPPTQLYKVAGAINTQGETLQPYVDVTGEKAPVKLEIPQHEHFCLVRDNEGVFPIDTREQVKEAAAWFDNYYKSLHPADRREYAIKLAARAQELGVDVSDLIKKYGSTEYAPSGEVHIAIQTRMQHWAEDSPERDMLKGLMGKYASVPPSVFCEALQMFDKATGLDKEWDESVYDPWYSTYGFRKTAEWAFSYAGDRITSDQLRNFAKSEKFRNLEKIFGEEIAEELKKDPERIFDSLPLDSKRIIMRMVLDTQP